MTAANPVRVAVIPARGGSKRVPRKNIRPLDGRPLLAWAVDTSLRAGCFDRVVVTTDDPEVAEVARAAGAEVPFVRADDLADDHSSLLGVVADAVDRLELADDSLACCVYPTAVGLLPADLTGALALLSGAHGADYVVGVVQYGHPIQRALARGDDGRLAMLDPGTVHTRTQDLEPRFHDAGQFTWGRVRAWRTGVPVLTAAAGYELPAWRAVDLDTEDDWTRAELLHAHLRA